jgi:uncharacterized protein
MDVILEVLTLMSELITPELLDILQTNYKLNWNGTHGIRHWNRVRDNGLAIAKINGSNQKVVEYFAYLHDCQRKDEWGDPGHGWRASDFIRARLVEHIDLSHSEFELLCYACAMHNEGYTEGDLTVQTCWDADRLDLMRVGIMPSKRRLCTAEAKSDEIFQWAVKRSQEGENG